MFTWCPSCAKRLSPLEQENGVCDVCTQKYLNEAKRRAEEREVAEQEKQHNGDKVKYVVLNNDKPAKMDSAPWDNNEFSSKAEAFTYAVNYLGMYGSMLVYPLHYPLLASEQGFEYSGHGDTIKIVEVQQ